MAIRPPPYVVGHDDELRELYGLIRARNRANGDLLRNLTSHDEAVWDDIRKNDAEIAGLWRRIYDIEQLWRLN